MGRIKLKLLRLLRRPWASEIDRRDTKIKNQKRMLFELQRQVEMLYKLNDMYVAREWERRKDQP